jgi:iron-sulfur cluster assembly protein
MAIRVTDKAKKELADLQIGGRKFLRIRVMPGGCSGMTYSAAVDSTLREGDQTLLQDGDLRIVADRGSALYLDGLEIDYSDDLVRSGFRFSNPNAVHSCGCGASFKTT